MDNLKSNKPQPNNANEPGNPPNSPPPLPLLTPVKNSPSPSPSPLVKENLRRFFLFEKKVHRILKDLSGCFKLLQVEINHLDRNDFLATILNPGMGEVADAIHRMEQLCVNQNPAFIPAKDPGPRENILSETQQKSDQEASDEYFKPKPQPPMETTKEYKRDSSPSETPHRRKPHKPRLEILSWENRESTPYPQLRNLPPELLDYTNVRFFSKETDASKPENKMSPRMKSYMAEIKRIYDEKDERDRKAAEAKAQAQSKPFSPNPDFDDARNAA
ncbi:MAG: hypothetical protein JWN25_2796 [Verrucomicrobiales bacterium]|nr:hypothetical protein [Verrucomicrobiales bacterium]